MTIQSQNSINEEEKVNKLDEVLGNAEIQFKTGLEKNLKSNKNQITELLKENQEIEEEKIVILEDNNNKDQQDISQNFSNKSKEDSSESEDGI